MRRPVYSNNMKGGTGLIENAEEMPQGCTDIYWINLVYTVSCVNEYLDTVLSGNKKV